MELLGVCLEVASSFERIVQEITHAINALLNSQIILKGSYNLFRRVGGDMSSPASIVALCSFLLVPDSSLECLDKHFRRPKSRLELPEKVFWRAGSQL